MRSVSTYITLLILLSFWHQKVKAQEIQFARDSFLLETGSAFLTIPATLVNETAGSYAIKLAIEAPKGWHMLSYSKEYELAANERKPLSLVVAKKRDATADWLALTLIIMVGNGERPKRKQVYISCEKQSEPSIVVPDSEVTITEDQKFFSYEFQVKNKGNFREKYFLHVHNKLLGIAFKSAFYLVPGQDSLFTFRHKTDPAFLVPNETENIKVDVTSETGKYVFNHLPLNFIPQTIKKAPSAYDLVTFSYETGIFSFNNKLSYYGSLKGDIDLGRSKLNFVYRTKQMGLANMVDNNIFGLTLKHKNSTYYAGDLTSTHLFYSRGLGVSISQTTNKGAAFSLSYIKSQEFKFLDGDVLTANARYKLPYRMVIEQKAAVNHKKGEAAKYILQNELHVLNNKLLKLSVGGSIGLDNQMAVGNRVGKAFNYMADFNYKSISLNSSVARNDKYFPGMGKAKRDERHTAKIKFKNLSLHGYMMHHSFLLNPFRDTLYLTDYLVSNTEKIAAGASFSFKKGNASFSFGRAQSTVESGNSLPRFQTVDVSTNLRIGKKASIQFASVSGFDAKKQFGDVAFSTNTRLSFAHSFGGFSGVFIRMPHFAKENNKRALKGFQETVFFGPSTNFTAFKTLNLNLSYQFQKSIVDNALTSFLAGNITYTGRRNGLILSMQFAQPVTRSTANALGLNSSSFNLTLAKQFRLPVPGTRKRHSLQFRLFTDGNQNGVFDKGEKPLEGKIILVANQKIRTNADGKASYINALPDTLAVDLSYTIKESYPAVGKQFAVTPDKNKVIDIPFVPSKVIRGRLEITTDDYSNLNFSLGNVKILATDKFGNVYNGLTDKNGGFSIYVPNGSFILSLSNDALGKELRTKQPSYAIDLADDDEPFIVIELIQNKRTIRFIN